MEKERAFIKGQMVQRPIAAAPKKEEVQYCNDTSNNMLISAS